MWNSVVLSTPATLQACADEALADIKQLEERMRATLEWSDVGILKAIIVFLDTQSWLTLCSRSNDSDTEEEEDDLRGSGQKQH